VSASQHDRVRALLDERTHVLADERTGRITGEIAALDLFHEPWTRLRDNLHSAAVLSQQP
jgi:hypothetical protein